VVKGITVIPDQILYLSEATYEFIYSQVLDGTNWQDALAAVKFRQESFAGSFGVHSDLLPLLTYAATGGEARAAIPLAAAWALYDLK